MPRGKRPDAPYMLDWFIARAEENKLKEYEEAEKEKERNKELCLKQN